MSLVCELACRPRAYPITAETLSSQRICLVYPIISLSQRSLRLCGVSCWMGTTWAFGELDCDRAIDLAQQVVQFVRERLT